MASPFDILGVDADADEAEIVRAYRQRVKETHPDHGGSASEFREVQTAYEQIQSGEDGADHEAAREGDEGQPGREQPGQPTRRRTQHRPEDQRRHTGSRVEYLNYEVLDEHGWKLTDEDLFEKAASEDLDPADHGRFLVEPHESLLEAAENRGFAWPYACRGGACANCAVAVREGEMSMPVDHILSSGMTDRGIRLSCNGVPVTDEMKVIYNVKRLPGLDELRLPPHPFEQAHAND